MVKDDSTERQKPKQPPEKLRFLGHSLTAFGHDSAASVTGSIKGRGGMKCEKRLKGCRFSIGSAPLTSITKSDAQISGGETRQDYKDPRRFPLVAPSCALLFRPCRLPDTCPPFSLREAWRFLIAHAVGISARCRSFAPSWAVCTNPPFSPTAAPIR